MIFFIYGHLFQVFSFLFLFYYILRKEFCNMSECSLCWCVFPSAGQVSTLFRVFVSFRTHMIRQFLLPVHRTRSALRHKSFDRFCWSCRASLVLSSAAFLLSLLFWSGCAWFRFGRLNRVGEAAGLLLFPGCWLKLFYCIELIAGFTGTWWFSSLILRIFWFHLDFFSFPGNQLHFSLF